MSPCFFPFFNFFLVQAEEQLQISEELLPRSSRCDEDYFAETGPYSALEAAMPILLHIIPVAPLIGGVIDKVIAARIIEQTVKQLWIRVVPRLINDQMSPEQVPVRTKR